MNRSTWLTTIISLLALLGASRQPPDARTQATQDEALAGLAGDWLYVEDRTEGRAADKRQPPMSVKFHLRVDKDAVVMSRGTRGEERMPLDGSVREEEKGSSVHRLTSSWKDGALVQTTEFLKGPEKEVATVIRMEFRPVDEGLLVRVVTSSPPGQVQLDGVALYRHPQDIALPEAAKAEIDDLAWLSGNWVGTRRTSSIEERWGPALGGAMLGVSRTVRQEKMVAFEYLRIVERDGGLVYIAQPGGNPPTEFVLTALSETRAVFDNPRHDSPQRIVYERSDDGLRATTSFINSGPSYHFDFKRESD